MSIFNFFLMSQDGRIIDRFCENDTTRKNKQGTFFPARNSVLITDFCKPDPVRKSQPVNDLMLIFPSQRNTLQPVERVFCRAAPSGTPEEGLLGG